MSWGNDVQTPATQIAGMDAAHSRQVFSRVVALKQAAEQVAADARRELIAVAKSLCPAWVDGLSETVPGIDAMSLEDIRKGIVAQVRHQQDALAWRARPTGEVQDNGEIVALYQEIERLKQENERLKHNVALLTAQDQQPPQPPPPAAQPSAVSVSGLDAGSPEAALLSLICAGEARSPALRDALAETLGISVRTGSITTAFQTLAEKGLIEEFPIEGLRGQPSLVGPTAAGLEASRQLTGQMVETSPLHILLKRHRAPAHTYLNLEAADLLRRLGYDVNLTPAEMRTGHGQFAPDILATSPAGEVFVVEVETGASKDSPRKQTRKWEVVARHTGGVLRVVCANDKALNKTRSAIELMATQYDGRLDIGLGVIAAMFDALKAGGEEVFLDDLWTHRRVFN
ncbi:MAG: hypothetical protein JXB47_01045 [Anaerolineae bacterium]|nr:hypothetical protein [Anaerolineae bacterium]